MWHSTMAATSGGVAGSICCSTLSTNTAVLPMPDLAWHSTSMPRIAWGMHSCCTAGYKKRTSERQAYQPSIMPAAALSCPCSDYESTQHAEAVAQRHWCHRSMQSPSDGCSKPQSLMACSGTGMLVTPTNKQC